MGPTSLPTSAPTASPTMSSTTSPTLSPTNSPTTSPTVSITASPTSSPIISISPTVDCTDNPNFAWNGDSNKDCGFIAIKTDNQKINWCNRYHKDPDTNEKTKISLNWCPKTCANFGGKPECISFPSAAPTFIPSIDQNNSPVSSPNVVPSLKPSLQPSSSTSSRTSSPPIFISPTVDCTDNPNFAWKGDENKDCAFIANKNLDSQKINWCDRYHKDPDA